MIQYNMEKIPTAKEWLQFYEDNAYPGTPLDKVLISFAEMHVTAALEKASEVKIAWKSEFLIRESIKNCYPLDLIK